MLPVRRKYVPVLILTFALLSDSWYIPSGGERCFILGALIHQKVENHGVHFPL